MTPDEVGRRLGELLADAEVAVGVSGGQAYARATVDVPPASWRDALLAARDDGELACDFFDWLSAVDELAGGFDVLAHLWSTRHRHGVLVRTRLPREAARVPSVVDIFPGADWHERETHEMFGIDFTGHPGLRPLLLPPEFEGHPLRKEFILASRVAKPWPGAKEPGESEAGTARRQPMRPPGVPAPGEWGPADQARPAPARRERPAARRPGARPGPGATARAEPAAEPATRPPAQPAEPPVSPAEPPAGPPGAGGAARGDDGEGSA
ncbi:NADH-quinone oxidoreductase subunit C [Micromonospora sp. NPDC049559]|uniref:NADH-quinone oxidoreductase subunit C n=1 Tax=Micromonospora sp. NPDC049559 TaxID=3155923 RepID=UPI003427E34C